MIPKTSTLPILLGCLILALPGAAMGQDDEASRQQELDRQRQEQIRQQLEQEQQQKIKETREQFINADMERARRSVTLPGRSLSSLDRGFVRTVPNFREAVEAYREAMSREGSLREPVKELDVFVDSFKAYFKETHVEAKPLNRAEFNDFSKKDLTWEALTTAERLDGNLRLAALGVQASLTSNQVTIQAMVLMRDVHTDLLRLELLLSKIK